MTSVEVACARAVETPNWAENLRLSLRDLRQVFADHADDARAPRSALQEIGARRPDLAGDVSKVQAQQVVIIDRLVELEQRSQGQTDDQLRRDIGSMLQTLSHYRQTCSDLFFNCYCVDVSAPIGD